MAKGRSRLARNLQRMLDESRADAVNESNQLRRKHDDLEQRTIELKARLALLEKKTAEQTDVARQIDNTLLDLNKLAVQAKNLGMAVQIQAGIDKHGDPAFMAMIVATAIIKR